MIKLRHYTKKPSVESDMKVIEYLYTNYRQLLFNKARLILENDSDAEDAVHAAFVRFMNESSRIHDFSIAENKKYLFIMVKGIALDMLEQKNKTVELTEDFPSTYDTGDTAEVNIAYEQVLNNINKLTPALKNVAALFWAEHLSEQEIANMLNMNINTVRSYICRARKLLGEMNKEENHD